MRGLVYRSLNALSLIQGRLSGAGLMPMHKNVIAPIYARKMVALSYQEVGTVQ